MLDSLPAKISTLKNALAKETTRVPHWGEIRQVGLIAGIDLIDEKDGSELDWRLETGARVCRLARRYGLLTRPVRDTLTLMPPLCCSEEQIQEMVFALAEATNGLLSE